MNPSAEKQYEPDPGNTVLLVDEDSEYLEHIRRITQGMGYNIHACNSYAEGIRQLECGAFEFIIVGQGSRFFEGRCVVECAIKVNRQLPVVVVARQLEMECYPQAMQVGAVDYVAEPSVGAEIAQILHNHLRHHQS
jgi:DNA-binding NtrC family response regulator